MSIQDSNHKEFLTLEDLSVKYGLRLSTLRRWASERKFPLYRVSNRIRVSESEFAEWWSQFRVEGMGKGAKI